MGKLCCERAEESFGAFRKDVRGRSALRGSSPGYPSSALWRNGVAKRGRGVCGGRRGECVECGAWESVGALPCAGEGLPDKTEPRRRALRRRDVVGRGRGARRTRLALASASGRRRGSDRRAEGPPEGKKREYDGGQRVGGVHAPEGDGGESAERAERRAEVDGQRVGGHDEHRV